MARNMSYFLGENCSLLLMSGRGLVSDELQATALLIYPDLCEGINNTF